MAFRAQVYSDLQSDLQRFRFVPIEADDAMRWAKASEGGLVFAFAGLLVVGALSLPFVLTGGAAVALLAAPVCREYTMMLARGRRRTQETIVNMGFEHRLRDLRPLARAHRTRRALDVVGDRLARSLRRRCLESLGGILALDLPVQVIVVDVDGQRRRRGKRWLVLGARFGGLLCPLCA